MTFFSDFLENLKMVHFLKILFETVLVIFLFLSDLNVQSNEITNSSECVQWSKEHIFKNSERHLPNLTEHFIMLNSGLSELNISSCPLQFRVNKNYNFLLKIYVQKSTLFNNDIDMKNVLEIFQTGSVHYMSKILFQNINGFNFNSKNHSLYFAQKTYQILFTNTLFEFYFKQTFIGKEICKHLLEDKEYVNHFGSIRYLLFAENTFYKSKICPYVFAENNLNQLTFTHLSDSFIFENKLEFLQLYNNGSQIEFNPHLYQLTLSAYNYPMNGKILDKNIFRNVQILFLEGSLRQIQSDLFVTFSRLKFLQINIVSSLRDFYHSGTEWMSNLNTNVNDYTNLESRQLTQSQLRNEVFIVQFRQEASITQHIYEYPNEDLCLFRDFPHKRLVFPSFIFDKNISCSCTLIWLITFYNVYFENNQSEFYNLAMFNDNGLNLINITLSMCMNFKMKSCNFEETFNKCTSIRNTQTFISFSYEMDNYYNFKNLQFIFLVILKPILCLIGIFTNYLIILVVHNKKRKKIFKNLMYDHILFNSLVNIFLCLIHAISLINICIFQENSRFCSSVYKNMTSQYYKIYILFYLGNVCLLLSNVSFIFIAISRYFLSTADYNVLYETFKSVNLKRFYFFLFIFFSVFSLFKIFEYKPNEVYNTFDLEFPYDAIDRAKYCGFRDGKFLTQSMRISCGLFPILNLVNSVLNNVVFLFVSIAIDVLMVKFAQDNIRRKKHVAIDGKHLEDAKKLKNKINKMILINVLLYFLSHIPDFLTTLVLIVLKNNFTQFCYGYFSCQELLEISQGLNFLSISLNFFVYLLFDKNFLKSFKDLLWCF
jgi:hypothetical protein